MNRTGILGRMAAASLLSFLVAACSTSSNALAELGRLTPCPVRIGVAEFPAMSAPSGGDVMESDASPAELQEMLAAALVRARTASDIQRVGAGASEDDFDLILTPRISKRPSFAHEGWASSWWASGSLWLLTWVGGLAVEDSSYSTDMSLEFDLRFPESGRNRVREYESGAVNTAFFERNDFMSWPTAQSLVLPPFLTSDQGDTTRAALTQRAMDSVAAAFARDLKQNFRQLEEVERCSLTSVTPANGARVEGSSVELAGSVRTTARVNQVTAELQGSGSGPQVAKLGNRRDLDVQMMSQAADFSVRVSGLQLGPNYIRIAISADETSFRTILVERTR